MCSMIVCAPPLVDAVHEQGPGDGDRMVVLGFLGPVDLRVGHRADHVRQRCCQRAQGRNGALPGLRIAGVADQGHDRELAVMLLGQERHRRRRHHVGDRREFLGRRFGGRDEAGDRLGRGRQEEHAADDGRDLLEPELEPGDDPEVAAAATDRPEQVRLVVGIDPVDTPVGGHDLRGEQRIDRHPELAHEVADPAAGRQPTEPNGSRVAKPGGKTVLGRGLRIVAGGQARTRPGGTALDVDVERLADRGGRSRCRLRSCCAPHCCDRRSGPRARARCPWQGRSHEPRPSRRPRGRSRRDVDRYRP